MLYTVGFVFEHNWCCTELRCGNDVAFYLASVLKCVKTGGDLDESQEL
jgi:hypothetical protein